MEESKENSSPSPVSGEENGVSLTHKTGELNNLHLSLVVFGLWVSLFLCALETTIVSTALIKISSELHDLNDAGWIVVAYLLTYNVHVNGMGPIAFILIWSKLSDTFGTKWLLIVANIFFGGFSLACAVARTMIQLIIFRAFQGIGGSGMYSLVFVVLAKIVPMDKLGLCTGILSSCFAMASLLGPILGGVIADNTSWRWIFWLNIPAIALLLVLLFIYMPPDKTIHNIKSSVHQIDIFGAFLSLAWAIPLLFALEEGGSVAKYAWSTGIIIGTLVTGIVMLAIFMGWEYIVFRKGRREPIFPVALLGDGIVGTLFLTMLTTGFCWYVSIIQIPQRYQHVNLTSATRAGLLLLPLTLISPVFAMAGGSLIGRYPSFSSPIAFLGTILNLVGMALMSSLSTSLSLPKEQFGYQVIIGAGLGLIMPALMFMLKIEVADNVIAAAMGAVNMARTLGGCVGLAICSSLLHSKLDKELPVFLTKGQIEGLSSGIAGGGLSEGDMGRVAGIYGESYDMQFRVMIAFAGVNVLAAGLLWWRVWRRDRLKGRSVEERGGEESVAAGNVEE